MLIFPYCYAFILENDLNFIIHGLIAVLVWGEIDGLVQDCSNSIANALELLQSCTKPSIWWFNTLRPEQNQWHFTENTFKMHFLKDIFHILIKISLKCIPMVSIEVSEYIGAYAFQNILSLLTRVFGI